MLQLRDHKHKSDMAKHTESVTSCPSSRVRAGQLTVSGFSVEMRLVAPRPSTRNVPYPLWYPFLKFVCTDDRHVKKCNYVLLPRAAGEVYLVSAKIDGEGNGVQQLAAAKQQHTAATPALTRRYGRRHAGELLSAAGVGSWSRCSLGASGLLCLHPRRKLGL